MSAKNSWGDVGVVNVVVGTKGRGEAQDLTIKKFN